MAMSAFCVIRVSRIVLVYVYFRNDGLIIILLCCVWTSVLCVWWANLLSNLLPQDGRRATCGI